MIYFWDKMIYKHTYITFSINMFLFVDIYNHVRQAFIHKSNNVFFFPVRNFRKHNILPSVNIRDTASDVKFLTSLEIPKTLPSTPLFVFTIPNPCK